MLFNPTKGEGQRFLFWYFDTVYIGHLLSLEFMCWLTTVSYVFHNTWALHGFKSDENCQEFER